MNSTITKIEKRLSAQKADQAANRAALEAAKNEYTNQIKGGKHPDSLTGLSLQLAEFTTRQTGLDLAVQMTSEELEAARKQDASPETAKIRKKLAEMKTKIDGYFQDAEKQVNALADQLRELETKVQEYNRLYRTVEGVNPHIYNGKDANHFRLLNRDLEAWLKQKKALHPGPVLGQEPNKGKKRPPQPKYRTYG